MKGGMMKREIVRKEGLMRVVATCLLVLTACLIRTNSETKILFDVLEKKATFRDVYIFVIQFYVVCAAAGYSFLQLIRCFLLGSQSHDQPGTGTGHLSFPNHLLMATTFLLDQVAVYMVFATNCAAMMASVLAVVGNEKWQWQKVCNMYTRFCHQVGGYLILGFATSLLLAYISALSAFFLFRFYSPNRFLCLKTQPLANVM